MLALITATRNSMSTLPGSLRSLAGVRHPVKQYFVDGHSADGTWEYLQEYVATHANAVLLAQRGAGLYGALNEGFEAAVDDPDVSHIGMLHSDDELIPDAFDSYLDMIDRESASFFFSGVEFHNLAHERVRVWNAGDFSRFKLYTGWMPPHTSVIVAKSIYQEHGLYNPEFGTAADYEWLVRVMLNTQGGIKRFPGRTVSMLVGGASSAGLAARLRANAMDGKAWAEISGLGGLFIRFAKPARKIGQFLWTK